VLAADGANPAELYNLAQDPSESKNLATIESTRFSKMLQQLQEMNHSIESEGPDWWRRLSANGGKSIPMKPVPIPK
jgi:hypothetical protein